MRGELVEEEPSECRGCIKQQEEGVKVTFFDNSTGTITNGTIWIKFNYTFTEPAPEEIDYTQEGLKLNQSER